MPDTKIEMVLQVLCSWYHFIQANIPCQSKQMQGKQQVEMNSWEVTESFALFPKPWIHKCLSRTGFPVGKKGKEDLF